MKIIIILILGGIISCNSNSVSNKEISNSIDNSTQLSNKISDEYLFDFFEEFQDEMKKDEKNKISTLTHFPIDGDCIYYFVYGDKINDSNFILADNYIDEDKFINSFDKIFDDNAKYLISNVDIKRLIEDENYTFKKQADTNSYYTINFYQKDDFCNLSISYINKLESISEHSTIYRFKLINNSIKLYSIFCAG